MPEVGTLAIDKKETPRSLAGLAGDVSDLGKLDLDDNSDMRGGAQRRLAIKLAAGAGLSVALASCFVVLALGDGGRT